MRIKKKQGLASLIIVALLLTIIPVPLHAAPGTTFTVSETGTVIFSPLLQGYTTTQINGIKKDITLTKVGGDAIQNLAVSFSGGANSRFATGTVLPDTLGAGVQSATLKVFPKNGLAPGNYTETVTITADGGISHSFQVSFNVIALVHAATPVIHIQPIGESVDKDSFLMLDVWATISDSGTLNYQWFSNTTNSTTDGTPIQDANSEFFEVPTDTAGTTYYYVGVINTNNAVNGSKFTSVFSDVVEVNVLVHASAPSITSEPANEVANTGDTVTLDVGASSQDGGDLSYQWYSNTVNSTTGGTLVPGADNASLTIPTDAPGTFYYYAVVTNTNNSVNGVKTAALNSQIAQVTINPTYEIDPIVDQTAPKLVQGYDSSDPVTLTIKNSGTGHLTNTVVEISGSDADQFVVTQPDADVAAGSTTSFAIYAKAGLAPGTYAVTVTISATNLTDESFTFTQVVAAMELPAIPQQATGASGNRQALLSWNTVTGATYYNIYRVTGTAQYELLDTVSASSYTVLNLTNGTTYNFVVAAGNAGGLSDYSSLIQVTPATPPVFVSPPPQQANEEVEVIINGKAEKAGVLKKEFFNGQSVSTIIVDEGKIAERLEAEGEHLIITIPFDSSSDVVIGKLNGRLLKLLADSQSTVVLRTQHAAYTLPIKEINLSALFQQLEADDESVNIDFIIEMATPNDADLQKVKAAISANRLAIVGSPIRFTIRAESGDSSVENMIFGSYVERSLQLPEGVDPSQITTGVIIEEDGSIRHAPTKIVSIDGQYFAQINSMSNSVYALIRNTVAYDDTTTHWAGNSIHNMGARLIVNGINENRFAPDRSITRAEFAAIVVRALGLKLHPAQGSFKDVEQDVWYSDAVQTASAYGLINGFEDGTFRPQESITRQQAMLILSKAMKLTGLRGAESISSIAKIYYYHDGESVAAWAVTGVEDAISGGIVAGKDSRILAPQAVITRAEVAVMIERLLQNSVLID
ncbi:S-layer homology domain-containing protein [Paenibacillus sp. CAU 1782]